MHTKISTNTHGVMRMLTLHGFRYEEEWRDLWHKNWQEQITPWKKRCKKKEMKYTCIPFFEQVHLYAQPDSRQKAGLMAGLRNVDFECMQSDLPKLPESRSKRGPFGLCWRAIIIARQPACGTCLHTLCQQTDCPLCQINTHTVCQMNTHSVCVAAYLRQSPHIIYPVLLHQIFLSEANLTAWIWANEASWPSISQYRARIKNSLILA